MNTNSKHYEILAIEPWDIMKANFTTEEFVAYLKGNIIKYTLRSKGQDLSDAEKIKHYAEKLIEVLEKEDMDEFLDEDAKRIYGDYGYRQEDEPEPVKEPEGEHKFKVGDRVEVLNWKRHLGDDNKATIIRQNDKSVPTKKGYLVELDKELAGWKATEEKNGVACENTWWVYEDEIKLLEAKPKKTLEPNKWYDAEDFTVEELKALLPVGTKVLVIEDYTTNNTDNNAVELGKETWLSTTVQNIGKTASTERTRVGITRDIFFRRYFRIVEET